MPEEEKTDTKRKWYFRTSVVVIALLSLGPLALSLVWSNPHWGRRTKVLVTLLVLAATYALVAASIDAYKAAWKSYETLMKEM